MAGTYEIIIGNQSETYGFTKTMPLRFETLAEVKTAAEVLADIILGFGEGGSALMITKTSECKTDDKAADTFAEMLGEKP